MLVEVCANSLESALNAEKSGADRVELCSELGVGGVTPSYGLIKQVKNQLSIPVHVLIRPRSGDFDYSDYEFQIMKEDILMCKELGCEGVVSGILKDEHHLDVARTSALKEVAKDINFTFHRAFDWVAHPFEVLEELKDMQVQYILTSGQQLTALKGIALLKSLKQKAGKLVILPGGGVNEENAIAFKEAGFGAIHFSGSKKIKKLSEMPKILMNSMSFLQEDEITLSSRERIKTICDIVK